MTVAHFGASRLGGLLADSSPDDLVALRRVHCEGDPLPSATVDALRSRSAAQIVHGFGTLAAGGLLLAWECDANDPRVPPEGTPLGDASVKIVDALGAPVPPRCRR